MLVVGETTPGQLYKDTHWIERGVSLLRNKATTDLQELTTPFQAGKVNRY